MRTQALRRNGHGKPIISLDIDGTLADYHGWFLQFATFYFGRTFPPASATNHRMKLWRFMGISRDEYQDCKLAYRQGGMKRSMPCLEGAGDLVKRLRRDGAEVWICTTRPFMRLDNIDPDTQEWLRRNGVDYDALLFDPREGDEKYRELKRQAVGREILGCAEDLGEQAERAIRHLKVPVWLRNQPYNRTYWDIEHSGAGGMTETFAQPRGGEPYLVHRWDTADQLLAMAEKSLNAWRTHAIS